MNVHYRRPTRRPARTGGRRTKAASSCRAATTADAIIFTRIRCVRFAHRANLEWTAVSGRGTLYSFTVVHRAPSTAFAAEVPYVVAVVELDEGVRLMSNLIRCAPDAVRIGMPLKVAFRKLSDSVTLPVFEPR